MDSKLPSLNSSYNNSVRDEDSEPMFVAVSSDDEDSEQEKSESSPSN